MTFFWNVGTPLGLAAMSVQSFSLLTLRVAFSGLATTSNSVRHSRGMATCYEPIYLALLVQSVLMIAAQLALLWICIRYRPTTSPEAVGLASSRPFGFWQWTYFGQVCIAGHTTSNDVADILPKYVEFLAALM